MEQNRLGMRSLIFRATLLLCFVVACSDAFAADPSAASEKNVAVKAVKGAAKSEKEAARKPAAPPLSAEREAAALEFAQQNHPELMSLLQNLKQSAPREYQAALTELDRTVDRLAKLKEKFPERYEFQLTEWKITSRIRLLAARMAMSDDPAVEAELRTALRDRLELRLNAQRAERDRLQKRVERLDQTIGEMSSKMDAQVEKQFADLRSAMPSGKAAPKNKTKRPAAPAPSESKDDQK